MEWVDRLAAELSLDVLSPHEKDHLLTASREVAHRIERKATPLAMYVIGLSVGSQLSDRAPGRLDRGRDPRACCCACPPPTRAEPVRVPGGRLVP